MLTKALRGLKIIDESAGRVQAVFATFDVIDHDNDVTLKGAFEKGAPVRVSAYNHASWTGALPVGKGVIDETSDGAVADLQFFMNTTHGADTFETVKQMGELQEWSYGYDIDDAEPGTKDGQSVQFLKRLKVHEVSPVLLGSGIATRTVAAKGRKLATCDECGKSTTPLFDGGGALKALICQGCGHVDRRKQLDSDLEGELWDAGNARFGGRNVWVYLFDHDVDANFAVFGVCDWSDEDGDTDYFKVPFTRGRDGSVTLGDDVAEVDPQTTFVPARDSKAKPSSERDAGSDPPAPADDKQTSDAESDENRPKASHDEPGPTLKLVDHLSTVQDAVEGLVARVRDVQTLRAEQGKQLGDETRERALKLADQLDAQATALREVVTSAAADTEPSDSNALTLDDEVEMAETFARHGLSL